MGVASPCFAQVERRAALDIGSGQIKLQVADVDLKTNKIVAVLLNENARIPLREDLLKNTDGRFSLGIQNQLVEAVSNLREKAAPFQPKAYHAIATESLRLGKNSDEIVERLERETGIPVTIISQEEEGILGFISALNEIDADRDRVVCWDFGGGSFQITAQNEDQFDIYQGRIGRVPLAVALLQIQGKEPPLSPNPISKAEAVQTIGWIQDQIQNVPSEISQKLKHPEVVVLGVGIHPLWGIEDNRRFDRERLLKEIDDRLGMDDAGILAKDSIGPERKDAVSYVVSNMILAYGVMEALDIQQVHYVGTKGANAVGLLLSPHYWKSDDKARSLSN